MSDLIEREAVLQEINPITGECWEAGDAAMRCYEIVKNAPAVDAVPISSLIELRDWLYEHDAITLEGRRWLDNLIGGGDNGA